MSGNSESMIDRVAKAITSSREIPTLLPWEQIAARAAIGAMREEDLRFELAFRKFKTLHESKGECWLWQGAIDRRDGYGRFYDGSGSTIGAHQFAYRYFKGEIPSGLVIDHTCRNRACVNPEHLRVVSNAENVLSGEGPTARFARAKVCKRGHLFTEENTYYRPNGLRMCRTCQQDRNRAFKTRKRAAAALGDHP